MKKWLLVLAILAAGYFGISFEKGSPWDESGTRILLVDHGYHTGLIFPRSALSDADFNMQALLLQFPDATFFEFGWGEAGFYQGAATIADVSWSQGAKALLWPSRSVMHVATGGSDPNILYAPADPLVILASQAATVRMLSFISDSFASLAPEGPGLYLVSRFYPAKGVYHLAQTCNNWTSQALRAGGFASSPIFASFSAPLLWEIRLRYGV